MCALNRKEMTKKISKLNTREKVTKVLLAELSRESLVYVYDSADIDMVNRLINVLTPINKTVAIEFFKKYLGYKCDKDTNEFGKKAAKKVYEKKQALAMDFLADELNNIFTFADKDLDIKPKAKNYAVKIGALVAKALADEVEGITLQEVMTAINSVENVSINDMLQSLEMEVAA